MAKSKRSKNIAILSRHSKVRLRERTNIPRKHFDREATQALRVGTKHRDAEGRLKKFLCRVYLKYGTASNLRVYREYIWIFNGNILVTIYNLTEAQKENAGLSKPVVCQVGEIA